ncbi:LysR substrate-binding domain-containing protein [Phenylobacterium immobile]|uniref:LysR substrate-binding domain-containing protein n=1 Tax=Phenylobacterium immobile TaxID=21 RepID=UPI000A527B1C|nr:LysR substrate-binding domain-containing protein [Phenylobacterium immobile]
MARRLPPLSTLRSFEAVVRLGSVRAAAGELDRTHGAVSKQIQALQQTLGAPLFDRVGTGVAPNAHGRMLGAMVGRALDDLSAGYAQVVDDLRAPPLHIACSVTFATRWLAPNLAAFTRAHPDIQVRLSMTSARELKTADADLTIAWDRTGFDAGAQGRAIPLAPIAFGLVCAPDYPVERSADSLRAPVRIDHDFTSRAWDLWSERSGVRLETEHSLSFPHSHLAIEAAITGQGVALVDRRLIRRELRANVLVAPTGFAVFPEGLAAISRTVTPGPAAQAMIDWMRDALTAR